MQRKTKNRIKAVQSWYNGWKESGLTQKEFCKRQDIKFSDFKMGLYQCRKKGLLDEHKKYSLSSFREVQITENSPSKKDVPYCEIRFSEQDKITISSKESLSSLKGLIECLQGI